MHYGAHTRGDTIFMVALIGGLTLFIGLLVYGFVSSISELNEKEREQRELWAGAQVVKICRSGTHIYKLRDGSHRTGGWHSPPVSGPEVCQ